VAGVIAMQQDVWYGDVLCFVLANNRLVDTVYAVLDRYIPNHTQLTEDAALSDEDLGVEFVDEPEMLSYFQAHLNRDATRYWQEDGKGKPNVMVGAHFTSDAQLIISLTVDGDGTIEENLFLDLKQLLQSETGFMSYNYFPEFKNGAAFQALCDSL
jgi:hypothetical protein